ncbi:Eco57I restriction-modification methylase domain-containing protein [Candidatus Chloroploca asiatica]|uniref:site-specific DNA-methyltransferase (adenine-specific) n=1 Tax=Candidatus Chloroploca asiatica TaxID=1506545 RepID=A0A2H3LC00_9CHLR|nr:Eco57I restriction-modification methylase domain-containing protein [Candidatus Chloroploca asiatica]PDW01174.1 hypothetical protein A9Q02_21215 [Candidatus Chloroploca asiatica]
MAALAPDLLSHLADADALRALFAALGYSPQAQISYSARTLDWPANVAVDLRGRAFELLADTDDGFFQVLLLAPHDNSSAGLSQALMQRLFASLEQRGNEAILIVPASDWGTLELVLLADLRPFDERQGAPSFLGFSFDPRAIRPHQLSALELLAVGDVGPGEAAATVARAFRRAQQECFFRSVNFFSTYYLEQRIAGDPAMEVGQTWHALRAQMPALRADLKVADARACLAALGWTIAPGRPERLLVGDQALALVAILPPEHPLDQALSAQSYPQLELIAALEQERQAGGLAWAILTNGRTWRLYSHLTASISGAFYEVELGDLLSYGSDEDLRYFAGFFGAAGLGSQFVGAVFASSQTLAREVGENLKQVVFQEVFQLLANAIADDLKRTGEYDGSEEQRRLIFRTTLILLYRILFVLYAESMRLLPTMHARYYAHSLTFLLSDIALQPFTATYLRKPLTPTAYWAWERLRELFGAISAGRPAWGVPRYNGGLFSEGAAPDGGVPHEHKTPHRLLARVRLGAMDLCKALDLLGRDPLARAATSQDAVRRMIDYAGLDVRRLGSIYEGLLEFQLAENAAGDLELRHTRADRKASGSYYTPDYIVAYIVEQAVGPVLDERAKQFAALMERLPAARRELERTTRAEGNERVSVATAKATSDAARKAVADLEHAAIESLLDLKILDPAMGSGHFLVSAVNFVTDRLIVILNRHREGNPILARLDGIRQQIQASLREQGVDELIADEQLNNVNLLRRLVMKRCVFGVDLNDMAVELARLSLWLNSFTVGAPLNFLDHHLKWGNSLIGARVQAVQAAMEGKDVGVGTQLDMFTSGSAFAEMLNLAGFIEELVEIADANAQQVEQSATLYAAYEQSVVPVKRLLDLWVSQSFGSKEASQLIRLYSGGRSEVVDLIDALMGRRTLDPASQRAVDNARTLFQRHRFLHWDLDFPEVFIDLRNKTWKPAEQMGFDAVVGNPPYFSINNLSQEEIVYLKTCSSVFAGNSDVLYYFIELVNQLPKSRGLLSYIVARYFQESKYSNKLRLFILTKARIREIVDFANYQVFGADVNVLASIIMMERRNFVSPEDSINRNENETMISRLINDKAGENQVGMALKQRDLSLFEIFSSQLPVSELPWNFSKLDFVAIFDKMRKSSIPLGDMTTIVQSMQSGLNEVLSPKRETAMAYQIEPELIHEIAKSGSILRYEFEELDRVTLWTQGVDLDNYPNTKKYLLPHKNKLAARFDIIARGSSWWEISTPRGVDLFFSEYPRILVPFIATGNKFCVDDKKRINDGGDIRAVFFDTRSGLHSEYTVCAILNSRLLNFYHLRNTKLKRGGYYEYFEGQLANLPIRRITFTTPEPERTALLRDATMLYERGLAMSATPETWRAWREQWAALWAWVEARLPQLADGTPDTANEQSDAVHDLLAFLAERMIALHKQKQADAAAFTDWLAQETGSAIEDWTLKTIVQSFWAQPWDEIERAVQKNRGRLLQTTGLRGKQADAALQPLLRAAQGRWAGAVETLAPTLAAITATDRLIDLLVYRLYGLTDEEIELVEGG